MLAAFGPEDFVSNATAGAIYGYSLLWTLALVVLTRYVILEATARYVVVTGETLMTGYARAGRWVVWVILVSIFVKRHLASLVHILLLGATMHLLFPLPVRWSSAIWAWIFSGLGFTLMYWGKYRMVEKVAKPLMVILGGSLLLAAVLSKPDLHAVARGALLPSVPEGYGVYSYTLVLMALTGAGAGSLSNLKYAAFVHERGWRDRSFLKRQRIDLLLSGIGLYLMFVLVQVAAAATLRSSGGELKRVEDLVPLFSAALGDAGRIVLALGLWAAVFTTYLGANTGYSLMVTDIWNNVLRRQQRPGSDPGPRSHAEHPAYRWCLIWFCASPMYVLLTSWKPLWLALLSAALMVVLLPVIVLVLLWMTNNRKRMGDHANGWAVNAAMLFAVVGAVYLTVANAIQVWSAVIAKAGTSAH